jgi:hypothetical protein
MRRTCYLILTGLLASCVAHPVRAADFYVSRAGSDQWSGKLPEPNAVKSDGPFGSLERARDAVRALRAHGSPIQPITVAIRAGTYYLERPFVLTAADSGAPQSPTIYEAVPGEDVILSGGRQITGKWAKDAKAIYSIATSWKFRQLFVNGRREIPARYPNLNPTDDRASWLYATADSDEHTIPLKAGTAKQEWANDPSASINLIAWSQ